MKQILFCDPAFVKNASMAILFYEYKNCSTCQKARKFLEKHDIGYTDKSIVDEPPSLKELQTMLSFLKKEGGSFKNLFNTSGVQYRQLKISEKIKEGLDEAEALKLLSQNGKLIKRPFLLTAKGGSVGFKEDLWKKLLEL